jgi:GT2 family glycosyltransferase
MVKLSIIIVSYNARDHLARCLTILYSRTQNLSFETIVVENASNDGSRYMLAQCFPQVRVIHSDQNLGFAKGCNLGARHVAGAYLLFLNSDTEVISDALSVLSRFLDEHKQVGVVSARLVYPDLSEQGVARSFPTPANAIWGRTTLLTRAFPRNRFSRRYLVSRENRSSEPFGVDWVSGACLMVRADIFRDLGGYDETFFMYWEDADLCFRVKQRSWSVFSVPAAVVIHHEGGSSRRKARLIMEFHRSAYRYYRKHHVKSTFSVLHLLALIGLTMRAVLLLMVYTVRKLILARRTVGTPSRHRSAVRAVEPQH